MRILAVLIFCCFSILKTSAQSKYYWVFFKEKTNHNNSYNAPVDLKNLQKISSKHVKVIGTSKWFNAAYISVNNPKKLQAIEKLACVDHIETGKKYHIEKLDTKASILNYGQADVQVNMLGLNTYHDSGFTGKGVKLALFDAGFLRVDSIIAFDSIRKRGGILATKDFVSGDSTVYNDDAHGMYVLSLIAGIVKDSMNGAAPDVNVVLARTEDAATEKHIEEFNWVKALEWADSIGVDIIHSSLGYSLFDSLQGDYKYQDMDGNSTIITRAAEIAFQRGIFITNSAGNEGKKNWKYITAPCDGKNVLCVGSVDSFRRKSDFSSFGPSADGRVKPDVMAMGSLVTIIGTNNIMRRGSGTSFSGPIIAGFVACLKQNFPDVNNQLMLEAIRKSGDRYLNPNDSFGYGIPNIHRADSLLRKMLSVKKQSFTSDIKIYPNPCNNLVYVDQAEQILNIELIDYTGKISLLNLNGNQIDLTEKSAGIYTLKLNESNGNARFIRLVKL